MAVEDVNKYSIKQKAWLRNTFFFKCLFFYLSAEKGHGAARCTPVSRPAVDLSQYFSHFGEREKETVAAFDFLDEVPSSPDDLQNRIHVKVKVTKDSPGDREPGKDGTSTSNARDLKLNKSTESSLKQKLIPVKENGTGKAVSSGASKTASQKSEEGSSKKDNSTSKTTPNKSKSQPKATSQLGRFRMFRKQSQGTEDNKKQAQGLDSANSNSTNEKSAIKNKEDKKILSKLPRKLIPTKNKSTKPKVESKIPKATAK